MLGPSKLGSYALLFFLTGLVTQIIHLLSKPGTMMRTFGVSDDDDDDVEEDDDKDAPEEASTRPSYTLGVGTLWTIMLAVTVIACWSSSSGPRSPSSCSTTPAQADAVVFATITGCVWAIFKLGEMVIWFEGRGAHLRADRGRSPGLQPDRDRRHPLGRRRGQGGDHRADDRHHDGHRDLRRADLVELRARASRSAS